MESFILIVIVALVVYALFGKKKKEKITLFDDGVMIKMKDLKSTDGKVIEIGDKVKKVAINDVVIFNKSAANRIKSERDGHIFIVAEKDIHGLVEK